MTLTELKYVVALAREKHFGRAADACFVSQPTLSVAIKKLEDELCVVLFERGAGEVSLTQIGERVVVQAQRVLEEASAIKTMAMQGKDPLQGPLRLGVIFTVAPYLLPYLVTKMIELAPAMPLLLQENYTLRLMEMLRQGEVDMVIAALPLDETGFTVVPLFEEPFVVAVPKKHPWAKRKGIDGDALRSENMLLLGAGHCFRDQVVGVCPELGQFQQQSDGIQKTFEGSSLETIRHMVASGVGITMLPSSAVPFAKTTDNLLSYVPVQDDKAKRTIVMVSRKSFARGAALDAVKEAVHSCPLHNVRNLIGNV